MSDLDPSSGIEAELEKLRKRLLDLTAKNALLSFKHTVGRSLPLVNASPDAVFKRLVAGKNCTIHPIPAPAPLECKLVDGKRERPNVAEYARAHKISPDVEFVTDWHGPEAGPGEDPEVHAVHYPEDLESRCRKIGRLAQSSIEETGTNMLYVVFGFLEFYDSDDSDKALAAPLIALPVRLNRGRADARTQVYRYELQFTNEEVSENLSLREKLRQDFALELPQLDEDAPPSEYFRAIEDAVRHRPRWRVQRRMTLGLLSFAKMMLVKDIDPKNWPQFANGSLLSEHPIVRQLFEGRTETAAEPHDGPLQVAHQLDDSLVFDADSSQHSALREALAGQNLVIIGPPGTGKSQTIANLIASSVALGKKVLFVSEKLAALEVVKNRLDLAGLGDFCLELHSNKSDKKRVIDSLATRLEHKTEHPRDLDHKLGQLGQRQTSLRRYEELMNSVAGNEVGLKVFDVLWRSERHRQAVSMGAEALRSVVVERAPFVGHGEFDEMRQAVRDLAQHFNEIEVYGPGHPWYGFFPEVVNPGMDLAISNALAKFRRDAQEFDDAMATLRALAMAKVPSADAQLVEFVRAVEGLPTPANSLATGVLAEVFSLPGSPVGVALTQIERLRVHCTRAMQLVPEFERVLLSSAAFEEADLAQLVSVLSECGDWGLASVSVASAVRTATRLRAETDLAVEALARLTDIASATGVDFDGTDRDVMRLAALCRAAGSAPQQLLHRGRAEMQQPHAASLLAAAKTRADLLAEHRRRVEEWCNFDDVELTEIKRAVRTLRQGDAWYRIFQGEWRAAVRLHRALSRGANQKPTAVEAADQLQDLARYMDAKSELVNDTELQSMFGPAFRGMETDFAGLGLLVDWYREAHDMLVQFGREADEAFLFAAPPRRIENLAHSAAAAGIAQEALSRLQMDLRASVGRARACVAATDERAAWSDRLEVVHGLLASMSGAHDALLAHALGDATPEMIARAVAALREHRAIVEAIDGDSACKLLLGEHFRGVETDFNALEPTLGWGRAVTRALSLPAATRAALLKPDCVDRLFELRAAGAWAMRASSFREPLAELLGKYGHFDWKNWIAGEAQATADDTTVGLRVRAQRAADAMDGLLPWAQYNHARRRLGDQGLGALTALLENGATAAAQLEDAFLWRFHASIAEAIFHSNPELGRFSATTHAEVRREFAKLDRETIALRGKAAASAATAVANPPVGRSGSRVDERTEMELLRHLIPQQRPRVSIRQLMKRAGHAILELKPCVMMGPLSVAQYLEPGILMFDLVVMDEASQLPQEEALGAIARGRQLVVVGDPKQLPPTNFFNKISITDDDDADATILSESDSILETCEPLFRKRDLRWHYRSRHERLIAFSNHHFYDGRLIVFPSPFPQSRELGVHFHHVQDGEYHNRQNLKEALRVVDAILQHVRLRPDKSLGVVALNRTQSDLIEEIAETRLKHFHEFENFRSEWLRLGYPFFVKNLENVQGDERDVMFISATYGKAPGGTSVMQRFGPITHSHRRMGERRLNVLFTRAKHSLHVYSSMQADDIVVDAKTSVGTQRFRDYLRYAAGGSVEGPTITEREPDSDFEISVANALRDKGYVVQPQLGVAGYFIDLAVRNPRRPGEFLAAIECDGATYHSGVSVRDRDRIRQEVLENLGWKDKIWRIWSADWFRSPRHQIERLVGFLQRLESASPTVEAPEPSVGQVGKRKNSHEGSQLIQISLPLEVEVQAEDLCVEVGDKVTYIAVDAPNQVKTVTIVNDHTANTTDRVHRSKPLAMALLNAATGDEVILELPDRPHRVLRVVAVGREA